MHAFIAHLNALDPRLWPLLLALVVYGLVHAWRTLLPASFDSVPPRLRAVPPLLLSAVLSASAHELSNWAGMFTEIVLGAASGTMAVGTHETVVRLLTGSGSRSAPEAGEVAAPDPSSE